MIQLKLPTQPWKKTALRILLGFLLIAAITLLVVMPRGTEDYLIYGIDQYGSLDADGRSDAMMLVRLDHRHHRIFAVSLARDLFIEQENGRKTKINTVVRGNTGEGGDELCSVIAKNFGIEPDAWVRINFSSLVSVVDALGGVSVQLSAEEARYIDKNAGRYHGYPLSEGVCLLNGGQALPWRAVVITERDADILNNDMAQRLAPACRISDISWIQPGKVAWDWWNSCNITGVDFKSGMNTDTYLYYIDFAARNKIEYIIIDEGWSGKESLMEDLSPDIDLPRLIAYGREKGVGIILWSSWRNLIGSDPEKGAAVTETVMKHYADMGIKGFKVDFFDRDDQQVIASAYQVAACGARHHLYLDFHGLKPFGIQRAYPNIFNFEGVKGLENSKWEPRVGDGPLHNQPRYDVTAPYLRMLAGPMDYTR